MVHMYIHDTFIPIILEFISKGATKANILVNYGLTIICKETVVDWLIKIGFK